MDLLSLILTCSLYLEDDDLVRAIAESNSHSNPNSVLDASLDATEVDPPPPPKTVEAAVALEEEVVHQGGRPLLGLLTVPPDWLSAFGRELPSAFDPCTNIAVGSAMLSEFDAECASEIASARPAAKPRAQSSRETRRRCVLGHYGEAIGLADFVTITRLELRYQRPVRPKVEDAPIFAAPSAGGWGPDRLLVSLAPLSILTVVTRP